MVVVRLVRGRLKVFGKPMQYYMPVDNKSFGMLMGATGYGWFRPVEWERVAEQVRFTYGVPMSSRWYHIKRRQDFKQGHVRMLDGSVVSEYTLTDAEREARTSGRSM